MSDSVNHPSHYTEGGIETIDFITAKKLDYELGNVIKYVSRAPYKGRYIEDLKKAQWYLSHKIQQVEVEQAKAIGLSIDRVSEALGNWKEGDEEVRKRGKDAVQD